MTAFGDDHDFDADDAATFPVVGVRTYACCGDPKRCDGCARMRASMVRGVQIGFGVYEICRECWDALRESCAKNGL